MIQFTDELFKCKKGAVYRFHNIKEDKSYIGSSLVPISRIKAHMRGASSFGKIYMQNPDDFEIEILEKDIPQDILRERELFYIKKFDSVVNGYNKTYQTISGPKGPVGARPLTDELYKLTNTETGEVYYCITPTDYCTIVGCSQAQRYKFGVDGKWRNWKLEVIDGSKIKWGDIYKHNRHAKD